MDTQRIGLDKEMNDGIEKMFSYYRQWKVEREKHEDEDVRERYDPETEQLLREHLISKVISVQQMFENPEETQRKKLWTKKRKTAIMNMAQITSILQTMAQARPKKQKPKKVRKVVLAPPLKEDKPKVIPLEGYLNLSSLLPKVDMNTMQTRSFRWSRERMTSLIEDYVSTDHMKENARLEQTHGIKPALLKLDFTREVSLPIIPEWNSLPESQSLELENEMLNPSDSPKSKLDALDNKSQYNRRSSRDPRRLSSRMSQRVLSAASSKCTPSGTTSPRKMSIGMSQGGDLSKFSKFGGKRFSTVAFNAIEEEINDGHGSDSTISPLGFLPNRMSPGKLRLRNFENSPTHMPSQDELKEKDFVIDKQRYYRKWWEKKKKSYRTQVQFDCPDYIEPKKSKEQGSNLPKSPPYKAHLDLHQTFVGFNPEGSLGKEKLEQYRKRRLEELFLDVKKFIDFQEESRSKSQSRRQHSVRGN